MTYGLFLWIFLGIPLALAGLAAWRDRRSGRTLPAGLSSLPAWIGVAAHVLAAVAYTTPWDNYLVANGVWYYNPRLVTGLTLGWVPVEEYTFFVLQTLLAGLWVVWLARRLPEPPAPGAVEGWRATALLALGLAWLASLGLLFSGWRPGTYLGLVLAWALPPIMLQAAFGADLLWRRRRLVGLALLPITLYLGAVDSLAIRAGTWTIDPGQSLKVFLPGGLPLEELVFFLLTNTLLVFGLTLALDCASRARAAGLPPHFQLFLLKGKKYKTE